MRKKLSSQKVVLGQLGLHRELGPYTPHIPLKHTTDLKARANAKKILNERHRKISVTLDEAKNPYTPKI